jgi:hypothetical protein
MRQNISDIAYGQRHPGIGLVPQIDHQVRFGICRAIDLQMAKYRGKTCAQAFSRQSEQDSAPAESAPRFVIVIRTAARPDKRLTHLLEG